MDKVLYAVAATVTSLVIASLLLFLVVQRRRHRAMQLLAMAQEDAERRRRNRKKAGLRRWEIDTVCPEAVFTHTSSDSQPRLCKLEDRPAEYISAVSRLGITRPPDVHPAHPEVPPHAIALPDLQHTCVICLDDLAIGQHVRVLPCNHVYHAQCIRVWLRRKNACPCCCEKVIKRRRKRPQSSSLTPVRPIRLDDRTEDSSVIDTQKSLPDDADTSYDRFNSEASCQLDEPSAAELLHQVRRALRGESSTISLNTSVADLEDVNTCRSLPEVASFGCSSFDLEEREEPQEIHAKLHSTHDCESLQIEETPDKVVIDLESTSTSEFLTPPPERFFLDEDRYEEPSPIIV